jgi:hypothetical protein
MRPSSLVLFWLAGNVALLVLSTARPRWRGLLFGEDRAVETATALLFLATFTSAAAFLIAGSQRYRGLLFMAGGLGLLAFLDEISFGARLFGWPMPAMSGGGEFDGAHDLVILAYRLGSEADPIIIGAICLGVLVMALLCALRWRRRGDVRAHRIVTEPAYGLLVLFVGGIAIASLLDLGIGFLERLGPLEEVVEMNAGLALLLAVLSTRRAGSAAANAAGGVP